MLESYRLIYDIPDLFSVSVTSELYVINTFLFFFFSPESLMMFEIMLVQ